MTIKEFIDVFIPLFILEIKEFLKKDMKNRMSSKTTLNEKGDHCSGSYLDNHILVD